MQEAVPTHPGVEANVLLSPDVRLLRFARVVWYALAVFTIGLFVVGTALRYHDLRQACTDSAEVCQQTLRLRPVNLEGIADPDAALRFYAVFYTLEQVALNVLVWAVAGVIVWRRSDSWTALLVAFWLLTLAPPFAGYTAALRWPWLTVPVRAMELLSVVCTVLFLFVFPSGRFVPQFMRWLACALIVLLGALLMPEVLAVIEGTLVFGGALALLYGSAFVGQIYRYHRVSTASERQQTKWVLFGIAVAAITLSVNQIWIGVDWNPDDRISPIFYVQVLIFAVGAAVIPITLGIAMVRYRLFDIDIIISRALVWGVLTAFVISAYLVIAGYVGTLLHWEQSPVLSVVAIGIITVVFQPLRLQVQRGVNRLVYGQRDEPYAVMTQLGQRLDATLSAEGVFQTIVEMIAKALRLPYVALYLHDGDQRLPWAEWLSPRAQRDVVTAHALTLPVTHHGVLVAELQLAPRQRNEDFSSTDWALLHDLARQAGSAIHAVQLTHDLQRSRERLVTAREEERRRLRRDLHDGLGPALAAQTLQLDAALDLLEPNPQAARSLLDQIKNQTQAVVADVRRLVYDLRPPALDELGVTGAISGFADVLSDVHCEVQVSGVIPPLPAAVEVATYRIATEAMTNVVKHARARTCTVDIRVDDRRWLAVEVCDDGDGLPPVHHFGVGLRSMRERAEELGGTLVIETAPGTGTCVRARLPLPKHDPHAVDTSNSP